MRFLVAAALITRLLHVCHAGSLQAAFAQVEKTFTAQHPDVTIDDVSGGSVTLARRLATGAQACDIYASADYKVIDVMLKPAGLADYTVIFARGRMVLAYVATDPNAQGISAANWHQKLLAPRVRVAGAHPFLDPGGYRAHMIMEVAERFYGMPGLYNSFLEHYMMPAIGALGKDFSFQFTYEHNAAATAKRDPAYRYLQLPDRLDLSAAANVTIPGLGLPGAASSVTIPGSRAAWGLTLPKKSANVDDAVAFLNMLFGSEGTAALNANGPTRVVPAIVSRGDYARLPKRLEGVAIE